MKLPKHEQRKAAAYRLRDQYYKRLADDFGRRRPLYETIQKRRRRALDRAALGLFLVSVISCATGYSHTGVALFGFAFLVVLGARALDEWHNNGTR